MLSYNGLPAVWKNPKFWQGLLQRYPGVFWQHDGNPDRPYALTTGGQVTDTYINFSRLPPEAASTFMQCLAHKINKWLPGHCAIIGQAEGGVPLAFDLARLLSLPYGFTRKWRKRRVLAVRCRHNFFRQANLLLIDDVYRSGSTLAKAREACILAGYTNLVSFDVVAVHRVEPGHVPSRQVVSAVTIPTRSWDRGENPYHGGEEVVPPVRPKGAGWEKLTRRY